MAETAALLADEVLPQKPLRQWVLSMPFALRFLLAADPETLTQVLGIVYRAISGFILRKARLTHATGDTGAATLVERVGSALNLNIHFQMLFLDGAYLAGTRPPVFRRIGAPSAKEVEEPRAVPRPDVIDAAVRRDPPLPAGLRKPRHEDLVRDGLVRLEREPSSVRRERRSRLGRPRVREERARP